MSVGDCQWVFFRALVSVGFKDRGTSCRRCILQQASLGRSADETRCPPRPAPIRTSQTHKEVVSGSHSPRDAFRVPTDRELLVAGVTKNFGVSVVGIAWLPICMLWYHLASVGLVLKSHVSHFSTFCCSFNLLHQLYFPPATLAHFLFIYIYIYIYVLHTKLTAYATFFHLEHWLWIHLVYPMHLTKFTTNPTTTDCTRGIS